MNPLTNIKNQQKLNQTELALGLTGKKSWHDQYKDSAWIFVGGLPYDLTEGDILCVFSQYGEIVNINLVRDQKSGKSKGFCFICYEDQRSTILTVDNLNGIKILGRMIRVDHVEDYKKPKEHGNEDEVTMKLRAEGCAPKLPDSPEEMSSEEEPLQVKVKVKKEKKMKVKKEKKSKKKKKRQSSSSDSESDSEPEEKFDKTKVKKEKFDPGYDKALNVGRDKYSSKRSYSPSDRTEGQKYPKYGKDIQDVGRDRSRGYDNTERSRDRDNRDVRRYENSYEDQRRDGEYKKNRNNDRDYVDRDSNRGFNKDFRNSDRHYDGGRDVRGFERSRDNRDFERKQISRDSGGYRERKNYDEMERSYHNRDERVYDEKDSRRRDRRDDRGENYRDSRR